MLEQILYIEYKCIKFLQDIIGKPQKDIFLKCTKFMTNNDNIIFIMFCNFIFYQNLKSFLDFILILFTIYVATNSKKIIFIQRPFNKYPLLYMKKKDTNSFPSCSMIKVTVFYKLLFQDYYWLFVYFIGISRIHRALHYPHDILISHFMGYFLIESYYFILNYII